MILKNNFILSICIPTYNRAKYLDKTIFSIINQKRFKDKNDVEIVISDNCSTDNTKEVSLKYSSIYPEKIRYFRNLNNIHAANVEKALSYGNGTYLKLNNDTLSHLDNSLDYLINLISNNIEKKDILFFPNGTIKKLKLSTCSDLNSFVKTVSFQSTWIGAFGIWKEDFDRLENFETIDELWLINDVLFNYILYKKTVKLDNAKIFDSISPKYKGGYNLYKLFITNYLNILEKYTNNYHISKATLFNEKTKLLYKYLIPWTLILWKDSSKYKFSQDAAFSIAFKKYRFHPLFYPGLLYLILRFLILDKIVMKYRNFKKN